MLRTATNLRGLPLRASDGDIGQCEDFLFDDERWTVRYLVANTGGWLSGRQVLISPVLLGGLDATTDHVPIELTREQINHAPPLSEDAPVSRQHEIELSRYYGHGYYWEYAGVWGAYPIPQPLRSPLSVPDAPFIHSDADPHLRSMAEVSGYTVKATDGDLGHVEDLLIDDESWTVRYLVVDTRDWLPGRKVLVGATWAADFDWAMRTAGVQLTKAQVKESPTYDHTADVDRDYETRLHDFYGRSAYWDVRGV